MDAGSTVQPIAVSLGLVDSKELGVAWVEAGGDTIVFCGLLSLLLGIKQCCEVEMGIGAIGVECYGPLEML